MHCKEWIDKLEVQPLERAEYIRLLSDYTEEDRLYAQEKARKIGDRYFGKQIFVRGLIEFTSYCKNDCYYCGLRRSNPKAKRYRLTEEEILDCCREGYALGFRTFVLQGGEDAYFTRERMVHIIRQIKGAYPDCALTLSIGERCQADYAAFRQAGADRSPIFRAFSLKRRIRHITVFCIRSPFPWSIGSNAWKRSRNWVSRPAAALWWDPPDRLRKPWQRTCCLSGGCNRKW